MTKTGASPGAESPSLGLMAESAPWLEPRRLLLLMVLAVFAVETVVMFVLQTLPPLSVPVEAVLDSSLLLLILSPTLYFFHYRPLQLHYRACRQAAERLQVGEERLRLAQAATNDGLWDWDIEQDSVYYNPRMEEMLGYTRDELKPFRSALWGILNPVEREGVVAALERHLAGESDFFRSEQRVRTRDGAWLWVLVRGQVVRRDMFGSPLRMVGTLTDINDRKLAEQDLLERQQDIQRLSRQLMSRSEEEKQHLAQDLHDEFGQVLSAFQLGVEMLQNRHYAGEEGYQQQCNRLLGLVNRLEMDIRQISRHLRPVMLDDLGLVPTLQTLIEEFDQHQPGLRISFSAVPLPGRLVPDLEVVCYRICQEALHNCLKHAQATRIEIDLKAVDDRIELSVRDNGKGFSADARNRHGVRGGMGLPGMRERAEAVDGHCEIQSEPGAGTQVRCRLPAVFLVEDLCQKSAS